MPPWRASPRIFPSPESVRTAFREATEQYGCVDILVNNAGVSESTPFTEYTEETFDKVMDLNVKGVFNATKAASECMIARGSGVILSTSSMVSISGQPSGFAYPASKFAVNGLTVSLARELGPKGIRVNAVAPGITETDMMRSVPKEIIDPMIRQIPLRRLGQPVDIANAFVFLASDEASAISPVWCSAWTEWLAPKQQSPSCVSAGGTFSSNTENGYFTAFMADSIPMGTPVMGWRNSRCLAHKRWYSNPISRDTCLDTSVPY